MTESQKAATARWRAKHPDQYKQYINAYYKNYVIENRDKENLRFRKYRAFLKESKRLMSILMI